LTVGFLSGHVEELVRFHCVPRSNICDAERCAVNKITFNGVAEAGTFQFDSLNAALANYVRGDRVCATLAFDDDCGGVVQQSIVLDDVPEDLKSDLGIYTDIGALDVITIDSYAGEEINQQAAEQEKCSVAQMGGISHSSRRSKLSLILADGLLRRDVDKSIPLDCVTGQCICNAQRGSQDSVAFDEAGSARAI
jgi:hypothetical protein